jgi:GGDEF domain-containing protein
LEGFTGRDEIARIVCEHAVEVIGTGDVLLLVRSVEGPRVLWSHSERGHPVVPWGPATLGALLSVGVPVREVIPADQGGGSSATAIMAVPVPSGGVHSGVLVARRPVTRPFFAAEEDAFARLARMAGAAFYAVNRRGWVGDAPDTDPVTGFWSVERLLGDLRAALRSMQDHRMPSCLVLAEITGLRGRRRTSSDPTAEAVLFALAEAIGAQLRVGDIAYRVGQDELAVLLPGTAMTEAHTVEARLRAHLGVMVPGWQIRTGTVAVVGVAEDVLAGARRSLADSEPRASERAKKPAAGAEKPAVGTKKPADGAKKKPEAKKASTAPGAARSPGKQGRSGGAAKARTPGAPRTSGPRQGRRRPRADGAGRSRSDIGESSGPR